MPETYSTSGTQSSGNDGPTDGASQRSSDSEGLQVVESSVLLQVSIVNNSTENIPIAVENSDYSTLECLQFLETTSVQQYRFTSEHHRPIYRLLSRTKSSLRRILSSRNRPISVRARSFMRRIQREVDLEMQNPDSAWIESFELEAAGPATSMFTQI